MNAFFRILAIAGVLGSLSSFAATAPTGLYKEAVDKLQALHQQYPAYTSIFSIGQNEEGTEILAMRISTTPTIADPKKVAHVVVATHHGNEQHCPGFAQNFMEQLLKRYTSRELFATNLADTEWTVIPVLNVTGYNSDNRYEHGFDPNREYPGICSHSTGGHLKSIVLMKQYLTTRVFTGSLTVHGYLGAITYPWGVDADNTHTLDHNQYEQITSKAAAIADYRAGTSTDVVYPCEGAYEDYVYWKHGMWSLLLELKNGSPDDIQKTTQATFSWFDQLDSSPSVKHEFNAHCNRSPRVDLHLE